MTGDSTSLSVRARSWVAGAAIAAFFIIVVLASGSGESLPEEPVSARAPAIVGPELPAVETVGTTMPQQPTGPKPEPAPMATVAPGWSQGSAGPLSSRTGSVAVWTGTDVLLWGGYNVYGRHDDGAGYQPATATWWPMSPAPIAGRQRTSAAWTGDNLFVFSERSALFDPKSNEWRSLPDPVETGWRPVAATWTGVDVIVISVTATPSEEGAAMRTVSYEPDGSCCVTLSAPPITFTYGHAFWVESRVLVIGGSEVGGNTEEPAFAWFDPASDEWSVLEPPPLRDVAGLEATWTGSELLVTDHNLQAAAWSPATGWRAFPDLPFDFAGCAPRLASVGNIVFIWYCRQAVLYVPGQTGWTRLQVPVIDPHAVSSSCTPVGIEKSVMMWCGNGDGAAPFAWRFEPDRQNLGERPQDHGR